MESTRLNKNNKVSENTSKINACVVDLFCGVGGLSHGFFQHGFDIVGGIDIDEECRYAYEVNNDAPFIRRNVTELLAKDVNDLFIPNTKRILVGCAPCQPFSTYIPRLPENPR